MHRHLTDQHLKDLGVSLAHRLKLLQASRDLGKASAAATAPHATVETESSQRGGTEHR